jgi:ABC-type lipoprotein export system ATPase subunit
MRGFSVLERFEIQNYRSCTETTIDLQPDLTVLIGPNGSGKTNILKALLLLRRLEDGDNSSNDEDEPISDECRIKASFRPTKDKAILTALVRLYTDDTNSDIIVGSHETWYIKDFTGSGVRLKAPLWMGRFMRRAPSKVRHARQIDLMYEFAEPYDIPLEFVPAFGDISKYVSGIRYFSASQFTNPSQCPVSFEIDSQGKVRRRPREGVHARFLSNLYKEFKSRSTSNYDSFFDAIGPSGIGLVDEIFFQEIKTSSVEHRVRSGGRVRKFSREKMLIVPQFRIGKNKLSPSQLSEGTFKTITLLFYVMTQQSTVLLIEEPEVCVHHGLLSSIVDLIKVSAQRKQIIMSTHSDFVLDQVEPRHVYRVSRTARKGTTVESIQRSLSPGELNALKSYLQSEGNLGEYWRHGGFE